MTQRKVPPPPPGDHFCANELLWIRSETEGLAWDVKVRVIYHLALPCPKCWHAVYELPPYEPSPLADDEAECREPVVRALCRLGMPEKELEELSEAHLGALVLAHHQPLAFCELLLEEARLVMQEWSDTPVKDLYAAFGPIGGNGVCLLAPREAHDLQARFFACLADACCEAGEARAAENAAAMAEAHLARGTSAEEPPRPATGPSGTKTRTRARPRKTARPRARRST